MSYMPTISVISELLLQSYFKVVRISMDNKKNAKGMSTFCK